LNITISDNHPGLKAARKAVFPAVPWQRCQFHCAQNAQHHSPNNSSRPEIAQAVRSIFDASNKQQALDNAANVAEQFKTKAPKFSAWLDENIEESLQVFHLPQQFQKKLRTTNSLELVNREVKRRTNVARIFPNSDSLLRLVTAVLVEIHENWITEKVPYLNLNLLAQMNEKTTTDSEIYRKNVA
jgi:putative transposase